MPGYRWCCKYCMIAYGKELRLRHTICIAHTLNLIVKKALDQTMVLSDIRANVRRLVGYFRSSTTAKACSLTLLRFLLYFACVTTAVTMTKCLFF